MPVTRIFPFLVPAAVLTVFCASAIACESEDLLCWLAEGEGARSQGRFEEARLAFEHAAAVVKAPDGRSAALDSPYARIWNELGGTYSDLGRPRDAENAYRKALSSLGASRVREIPALQINLGQAIEQQGRFDDARDLYRQAVAALERELGPHDPALSPPLRDLARLAQARHDFSRAEKFLDRARAIDGEAFAPDSLRIARDWNDAAALAAARKRYPDAERMLRQSLAIADGQLPAEHPQRAEIAANLAEVLYAQKRFAEAENLFKASLEILERAEGPLNPRLAGWLEHYAEVLHRSENYAEAERVRLRATRIRVENTLHPQ